MWKMPVGSFNASVYEQLGIDFEKNRLVWRAFFGVIVIPTVLGNLLILASVMSFKHLHSNMHVLIANLAVCDLMVGAVVLPCHTVFQTFPEVLQQKYVCLTHGAMFIAFLFCSLTNLLLISVERCSALLQPLKHLTMYSKASIAGMVTLSWMTSLTLALLPFFGLNTYSRGQNQTCSLHLVWTEEYKLIVALSVTIVFFVDLLMYVVALYIVCWKKPVSQAVSNQAAEQSKTRIILIVYLLFFICWLPFLVLSITVSIYKLRILDNALEFSVAVGYANSALNWIVYGVCNAEYRKAFKVLLCICRSTKNK